jgi:hypothetical protein
VEAYPTKGTAQIARELGRTVSAVYGMVQRLQLSKTDQFRSEAARATMLDPDRLARWRKSQFQPGQVPANKGLRRPGWGPGRMKETQFRQGERHGVAARKWLPVGTFRTDSDGYLRLKVREAAPGERFGFGNTSVWAFYQRWVWEQANGPIPAKHVVSFADGDRSNCALENLRLVSRAEMARRNRVWVRYPRELAEVIHLQGQVKRRVREHGKKQAD